MSTLTTNGVLHDDGTLVTNNATSQRAIFGYGANPFYSSITNLVNNYGGVATDTTGVGTPRWLLAAAGYGGDKAIFGYGFGDGGVSGYHNITNLVSNVGVVSTDATGVGTARAALAAAGYGGDKAIFGYGYNQFNTPDIFSLTNLVSNTGVVSGDVTGVGTARNSLGAAGYGGDKAIFGYGLSVSYQNITNLVSNTGVVSGDVTGVGTARAGVKATEYGGDKAIFLYGTFNYVTNLVSNTGVVSGDVTGVGTQRRGAPAAGYGGDKAIYGYGELTGGAINSTNLISNIGVIGADVTGVGTATRERAAASYSS